MRISTLTPFFLLTVLSAARTDISGCASSTVIVNGGASLQYYVPGTGEICQFLDCGGGTAPPKTTVPGCPLYSGTASYLPSYLANFPGGQGGQQVSSTALSAATLYTPPLLITNAPSSSVSAASSSFSAPVSSAESAVSSSFSNTSAAPSSSSSFSLSPSPSASSSTYSESASSTITMTATASLTSVSSTASGSGSATTAAAKSSSSSGAQAGLIPSAQGVLGAVAMGLAYLL